MAKSNHEQSQERFHALDSHDDLTYNANHKFTEDNIMPNAFAQKLKELRESQRIGVRELGRMCDCTGMHISNMEKGKAMPSGEMLKKLASALSANIDELSALADQIDPDVSRLIKDKHQAIPNFLRTAKDLTPEQWATLQAQVEAMTKGDD